MCLGWSSNVGFLMREGVMINILCYIYIRLAFFFFPQRYTDRRGLWSHSQCSAKHHLVSTLFLSLQPSGWSYVLVLSLFVHSLHLPHPGWRGNTPITIPALWLKPHYIASHHSSLGDFKNLTMTTGPITSFASWLCLTLHTFYWPTNRVYFEDLDCLFILWS